MGIRRFFPGKMSGVLGVAVSTVTLMSANAALAAAGSAFTNARTKTTELGVSAGLSSTPLPTVVGLLISGVLGLLGVILVVLIIYAGWLWMSAQGEADQVTKAKDIMKNAIIGLIIIACAYAISDFVFTQFLVSL